MNDLHCDERGRGDVVLVVAMVLLHETDPASNAEWEDLCGINERISGE
jgi:hypothetical protein